MLDMQEQEQDKKPDPELVYQVYLINNHLRCGRKLTFVARDGKNYQVLRAGIERGGWPVFVDCPGKLWTGRSVEFRWLLDETTLQVLVEQAR